MVLGPKNFNLTVSLDKLFCFQGDDIDNVMGPESEPYMWVFMIKIDGEGLHQDGNFLAGTPIFKAPTNSHGNIGGSIKYGTRPLPAEVGRWTTSLRPITISVPGQPPIEIPGRIICGGVLLEENLTPNSAIEAARRSTINLIERTVKSTLDSLGLAGLVADAAALVATSSNPLTMDKALQNILARRLKPIQDLFEVAAPSSAVVTILKNLDAGGFLGTAIDRDKPMGTFSQSFGQAELARSTQAGPIEINQKIWNMPEWAYTIHGQAWAHRKLVRRGLPTAARLQIMCSTKGAMLDGARRIVGIGGVEAQKSWGLWRDEAAQQILDGQRTFFVRSASGRETEVFARQGGYYAGRPWYYLQTAADSEEDNNLVNLPDCPNGGSIYDEIWF
ncbi:hypothetical protein P4V43_18885 [Brevibacillus fortis]|uniref:Uncharacterized protein n=1 Tax=Brevibacillus fortis TaxID=2126352 RepID=A0A2P7UGT4_9BACL|nr:DUF3892 domain-containing protein [Brevibacillus fortis]MED1783890.1 hypothetical protein [Brevibacillus fortis]PSJ86204.1 hypothetical protein C7R93_28870 [Brevibacillus fortis]